MSRSHGRGAGGGRPVWPWAVGFFVAAMLGARLVVGLLDQGSEPSTDPAAVPAGSTAVPREGRAERTSVRGGSDNERSFGGPVSLPAPRGGSGPGWRSPAGKQPAASAAEGLTGKGRQEGMQILALFGISDGDLSEEQRADPSALARALLDLKQSEQTDDDTGMADAVFFSTIEPDIVRGPDRETPFFSPFSGRIYAIFATEEPPFDRLGKVLVKWFSPELRQTYFFGYVDIAPGAPFSYAWCEREFWQPAFYNAEVYRLDDLVAIASGSYEVAEVEGFFGSLGLYADAEGVSRQDVFGVGQAIMARAVHTARQPTAIRFTVTEKSLNTVAMDVEVTLDPSSPGLFLAEVSSPERNLGPGDYRAEVRSVEGAVLGRAFFSVR